MLTRLKAIPAAIANGLLHLKPQSATVRRALPPVLLAGAVGLAAYGLVSHPPFYTVERGEVAVRTNQFSGAVSEYRDGRLLMIPGLYDVRSFPLRDQSFRPERLASAEGPAPLQSVEGLSLGMDLTVRYALDTSDSHNWREACPTTSKATSSSRPCRASSTS